MLFRSAVAYAALLSFATTFATDSLISRSMTFFHSTDSRSVNKRGNDESTGDGSFSNISSGKVFSSFTSRVSSFIDENRLREISSQGVSRQSNRVSRDAKSSSVGTPFILSLFESTEAYTTAVAANSVSVSPVLATLARTLSSIVARNNTRFNTSTSSSSTASATDSVPESCAPGCPVTWLNDGVCDNACDTEACEWDRGDCDVRSTTLSAANQRARYYRLLAKQARAQAAVGGAAESLLARLTAPPEAFALSAADLDAATAAIMAAQRRRENVDLRDRSSGIGSRCVSARTCTSIALSLANTTFSPAALPLEMTDDDVISSAADEAAIAAVAAARESQASATSNVKNKPQVDSKPS